MRDHIISYLNQLHVFPPYLMGLHNGAFATPLYRVVPALVEELCGTSILTMEFIDALHLPQVQDESRAREALVVALRALYRMIFVEGLIHCDLHQGNLHLLADGRAVIIDFGFIAELERADRVKFAEFFYSMAANSGVRCAQIILETASFFPSDFDYEAFEAKIVSLVNRVAGMKANEFQVTDFVVGLFDIQRRFRIRGTTAFTMAILSLLVFEGIAKRLYADLDFQQEAIPFILRASIRPPRV
jgi:ubiquinone biosynthesis protein